MSNMEAASTVSLIKFAPRPSIEQLLQKADRAQRDGERNLAERLIEIAFERLDEAYARSRIWPRAH